MRDQGVYARGHLLLASSAPYWRLEFDIAARVPRLDTRIVLVAEDELSRWAAAKLQRLGYSRLAWLEGGLRAWTQAGGRLFSGTNVLGKAFGGIVEHELGTPSIEASELKRRIDGGEPLVIVDSRITEESEAFSVDGARSLPGTELVYRIGQITPDPGTPIVVNCAGRTRSIIGAQTLINAGIPNPVASPKDGTMARLLDGHGLRHGARRPVAAPSGAQLARTREQAGALARRAGVAHIGAQELAELENRADRTLYRFDIRGRDEYAAGHLPGWRWAPGGQLVQASDECIAVRHAHVVLADWDGARAPTTASWLRQPCFDVSLYAPHEPCWLETGPETRRLASAYAFETSWITAEEFAGALAQARVVDVDNSIAYAGRRVAGATFVAPSRLLEFLRQGLGGQPLAVTSEDGTLAASVVRALRSRGIEGARALQGGTRGWIALGLAAESGRAAIYSGEDDVWYGPYVFETTSQRDAKFRQYLSWETGLAGLLGQEPGVNFSLLPALTGGGSP